VSFEQLYYTSCETGLSGYAGFQFNAVTDGTSAETKRAVEALASYEPPRSLAQSTSPDELARCPVNLCFAPGKTTVLASVGYVGRDSSNRVGNYFAHALATSDLDADDAQLLPIELWRAPWWARTVAPSTALPPLPGPLQTGPLSRDEVSQFIETHPDGARIAVLATAAGLAQSRDSRSVLVVAESAEEVAQWFAAVCYLLPPAWVRRLSFSTYLSRPSKSRLHLLGTLSETKLDLGPDATERFYLFDFPGQRFAELTVHPLARLCAAVGARALPSLWGWADSLASGRELTLDDWYPVVAAAAALGRVPLTGGDLAAVAAWLARRGDLERGTRSAIAQAVHGQPEVTVEARLTVRDVSAETGDETLWEQAQYELLEPSLRARADGQAAWAAVNGSAVPAGLAVAAERVRDQLTATAEEELRLATDHADTLRLLAWAGQAGLPVSGDVLAHCGQALVGPLIAADDDESRRLPAPLREQAAEVTGRWTEVREGMVRYLTGLADRDPAEAASAMSGLAGRLLTAGDIDADSPIRVFYLVAAAKRRGEPPARILAGLAQQGEVSGTDDVLLHLLWPDGRWTVADAGRVLATLPPRMLGGAFDWFEATVAVKPPPGERAAYASLCADLMAAPLADELATARRPALHEVRDLWLACKKARRVADLHAAIHSSAGGESAPAAVLAREWLAPRVVTLPAGKPAEILTALSELGGPAVRKYLALVMDRFRNPGDRAAVHVAALYLLLTETTPAYKWADPHLDQVNEIVVYAARWWSEARLEQAARLIDGVRPSYGADFREQVGGIRAGRFGGVVKVVRAVRKRWPRPGRGDAVSQGGPAAPEL
jgi:hypothetical protein